MDKNIKDECTIKNLLAKMPEDVSNSFSEQQLTHLFTALSTKNWAKHSIDLRGTYKIPFIPKRYYYVILFGKNRRELLRYESQLSLFASKAMLSLTILICTLLSLLALYLVKSALGIDLFKGHSLGIWSWFNAL